MSSIEISTFDINDGCGGCVEDVPPNETNPDGTPGKYMETDHWVEMKASRDVFFDIARRARSIAIRMASGGVAPSGYDELCDILDKAVKDN